MSFVQNQMNLVRTLFFRLHRFLAAGFRRMRRRIGPDQDMRRETETDPSVPDAWRELLARENDLQWLSFSPPKTEETATGTMPVMKKGAPGTASLWNDTIPVQARGLSRPGYDATPAAPPLLTNTKAAGALPDNVSITARRVNISFRGEPPENGAATGSREPACFLRPGKRAGTTMVPVFRESIAVSDGNDAAIAQGNSAKKAIHIHTVAPHRAESPSSGPEDDPDGRRPALYATVDTFDTPSGAGREKTSFVNTCGPIRNIPGNGRNPSAPIERARRVDGGGRHHDSNREYAVPGTPCVGMKPSPQEEENNYVSMEYRYNNAFTGDLPSSDNRRSPWIELPPLYIGNDIGSVVVDSPDDRRKRLQREQRGALWNV